MIQASGVFFGIEVHLMANLPSHVAHVRFQSKHNNFILDMCLPDSQSDVPAFTRAVAIVQGSPLELPVFMMGREAIVDLTGLFFLLHELNNARLHRQDLA
jgi:hypothetical protein